MGRPALHVRVHADGTSRREEPHSQQLHRINLDALDPRLDGFEPLLAGEVLHPQGQGRAELDLEVGVEFIVVLAKGRSDGVRLPPGRPPSRLRDAVLNSRLGPPLRALRRATKRSRN